MQPTSDKVYQQINNALYNEQGDIWWDENECLHLLKSSVNPARVGYFRRLLTKRLNSTVKARRRWMWAVVAAFLRRNLPRWAFA